MDVIIRKDAKLLGLKWYFTGKTCKHGHVAKRRVDDCVCLECKKIKDIRSAKTEGRKEYRKNNPEKSAKYSRFYLWQRHQATPHWYETDLIKQIYLKRNELSKLWDVDLHIDHIVPLQAENVCGLHCWDNLQILEASLNLSKSNIFVE